MSKTTYDFSQKKAIVKAELPLPGQQLYLKFIQFHTDNPEVYTELVSMARKLKARGRTKIGIGMLFEVLRWHYYMTTISDDEYKLANAHRAFYTRLIEQQEPDLQGFFTQSESVADGFFKFRSLYER